MDNNKNSGIRINKKMRLWNRYKLFVIGGVGVLAVIIVFSILLKGCSGNDNKGEETVTTKAVISQTKQAETNASAVTSASSSQAQTAAPQFNKVYTASKTLAKEDFKSSAFFEKSVFLGDSFVNGIEYYGYLSGKVVSNTNMTTDKATDYINEVASKSPEKIFIMVGINDLNYGSRTNDTIVANYTKLISGLKAALPNAKIYILSVLPITKEYESKTNVYIRKANLDDLNNKLKGLVGTANVDFVDLNPAIIDASGYLNTAVTTNGLNISNSYYGFILNTIAETIK